MNYLLVRYLTPVYAATIVAVIGIGLLFLADQEGILYCPDSENNPLELGYLHNLSWSVSMIVVFPAMTGLIVYYYQSLPRFVDQLFPADRQETIKSEFEATLQQCFNSRWFVLFIFTIGIAIHWLYFKELHNSNTWIWVDCQKPGITNGFTWSNRTWLSWCTAILQLVFTFIFLLFLFRAIGFAFKLKTLLERDGYINVAIPFHPDGTSGYGFIRERIFLTMLILTLLGIYVALYMFDKLHQEPDLPLAVTFLFVSFYILFSGTIVASSFYAAHLQMQRAKQKLLDPIGQSIKRHIEKIGTTEISQLNKQELEAIAQLKTLYKELNQQIPEWPLNIRSTADVMQGVVIPLFPAALALLSRL